MPSSCSPWPPCVARHRARGVSSRAVSSAVFVDGAYLALAVGATGGIRSVLDPLVFVELAAVTLLASRLEGVELGLWCALFVGTTTMWSI